MSFNIRGAFGVDGDQEFSLRKEFIAEKLKELSPDVIGFQEINHRMRRELIELLPSYAFLGGGREKTRLGEASLIAYKQDRLMPERLITDILSPEPHVCGTTYGEDQSKCPRVFSSCDFMPFDADTPIRVMNIHTDHIGKRARALELQQLYASYAEQQRLRPMPTVITGDFNATPDADEMKIIGESGVFTDLSAELEGTFHNFGRLDSPTKIDYIFATDEFKVLSVDIHKDKKEGLFLSDHYPISAILEL